MHSNAQFGEHKKLFLVRLLNSAVMVRIGGGWITLREFLHQKDPCRSASASSWPSPATSAAPLKLDLTFTLNTAASSAGPCI